MVQPTSTIHEQNARPISTFNAISAWRHVSTYLLNSSDSNNLGVDGSGGVPQSFSFTPPANYDFVANRLHIYLQAASAMSVDVFGDLGVVLGQGVEIKANGVLLTTWKDNIDIYVNLFDVDTLANVSDITPDFSLNGRWQFTRDTNGQGILVPNGTLFEAIVNDDLSTITQFRIKIKGKLIQAV